MADARLDNLQAAVIGLYRDGRFDYAQTHDSVRLTNDRLLAFLVDIAGSAESNGDLRAALRDAADAILDLEAELDPGLDQTAVQISERSAERVVKDASVYARVEVTGWPDGDVQNSVLLRRRDGAVERVGRFRYRDLAVCYAEELRVRYNLPRLTR